MSAEGTPVPVVYYDSDRYRTGEGRVRRIARALEVIPPTAMISAHEAKTLLWDAVGATIEAAHAVLEPLTEDDVATRRGGVGRESDLATDKAAFEKLPDLFKDGHPTSR